MKTPFRAAHGSYGFSNWDRKPSYTEALHFLRGLASTPLGARNLRHTLLKLSGAPGLAELNDQAVLENLATQLASGVFRVWESPSVTQDVALQREEVEAPPPPERMPAPAPVEQPPPVGKTAQADAFREAAEEGATFCEV